MQAVAEIPGLGQRVKELRLASGLTQQELAVKAGISLSVLSSIEQGESSDPRASTLLRLRRALGVDIVTLMGGLDTPEGKRRRKRKPSQEE